MIDIIYLFPPSGKINMTSKDKKNNYEKSFILYFNQILLMSTKTKEMIKKSLPILPPLNSKNCNVSQNRIKKI